MEDMTMRKREFVGICAVGAALICVFAFFLGKYNFKCGYKERDNDIKKYD